MGIDDEKVESTTTGIGNPKPLAGEQLGAGIKAPVNTDNSPKYTVVKAGQPFKVRLYDVIDENKDTWKTPSGAKIISLVGIKKIMSHEDIVEKDFQVNITPDEKNKQQHVVSIWLGRKGENSKDDWVRGSGEASILNTGEFKVDKTTNKLSYDEINHIDSNYRFAMAEKRALSRGLLKFVGLNDFYGQDEAKAFSKPQSQSANSTEF